MIESLNSENLQKINSLINIRNYIGFILQSNLPWLDKKDMNEMCDKMKHIDSELVVLIKQI